MECKLMHSENTLTEDSCWLCSWFGTWVLVCDCMHGTENSKLFANSINCFDIQLLKQGEVYTDY